MRRGSLSWTKPVSAALSSFADNNSSETSANLVPMPVDPQRAAGYWEGRAYPTYSNGESSSF